MKSNQTHGKLACATLYRSRIIHFHKKQIPNFIYFFLGFSDMDPSYYSPQPTSSRLHAVCYCRVHGNSTSMSPRNFPQHPQNYSDNPPSPITRQLNSCNPPSPITRQLMEKHPEALVIHTG